jgi:hypothetical protein
VPARRTGVAGRLCPGRLAGVDRSRRTELAAVVVIYVVPLTTALAFLVAVGLWRLAVALAAVEVVVLAAVVWVRRSTP